MHRMRRSVGAILVSAVLCGCAGPASCPSGLTAMIEADLYFGRSTADGLVSEEDWQRFVDTEITPRFPGGFTIQDTSGQWKAEGGIVREPSKRLVVVMPAGSRNQAKLEALREAYKARFKQDSVLLLETSTCGSF